MCAVMTLTIMEQLSRNSVGLMLSGGGTSSRDEKSNNKGASRLRPMQAFGYTDFKTGKPGRLTRTTVHNIYMGPAIVPAKSPSKMTAQFKTHDLNSSSKCIPVHLCTGIYHTYAQIFIDNVFWLHGLLEAIISDWDPRLTGKF